VLFSQNAQNRSQKTFYDFINHAWEMIMSTSTDDLIKIMEASSGLKLDVGTKSKDELVRIATTAGQFEVGVTFRNVTMNVDDLAEIAEAGDGCITFEF
jgi:hypothetical protein